MNLGVARVGAVDRYSHWFLKHARSGVCHPRGRTVHAAYLSTMDPSFVLKAGASENPNKNGLLKTSPGSTRLKIRSKHNKGMDAVGSLFGNLDAVV